MIPDAEWREFEDRREALEKASEFVTQYRPRPGTEAADAFFEALGGVPENRGTLAEYLRRPEVRIESMRRLIEEGTGLELTPAGWTSLETDHKYSGYLEQQRRHVERLEKAETRRIPSDFAFGGLPGLSREVIEKLERVRPRTLAQAGRIPGITPAAVSILNMHLESPAVERVGA